MKYKYQFSVFEDIDCRSIENKLNNMIASGYELVEIGPLFWVYRKCEPNSKKYATTIHESAIDIEWDKGLSEFDEYCSEAGWERVATLNRITIYSNNNLEAIDLNTDSYAEYNNVKKFVKKGITGTSIAYMLIAAYMCITAIRIEKPILDFLSSYVVFFATISLGIVIVLGIVSNIIAANWIRKSEKLMVEINEYADTRFLSRMVKLEILVMSFVFTAFLIVLLISGKPYTCVYYFSDILMLISIIAAMHKGLNCINKDYPEQKTRKRTEAVVKVAIFLIATILTFSSINEKNDEYYADRGTVWLYSDTSAVAGDDFYEYELYYPKSEKVYDFVLDYIENHNDDGDIIIEKDGNIFVIEEGTPSKYQEMILQKTVKI